MMNRTCANTVAALALSLIGGTAAAQDADLMAQMQQAEQQYEQAISSANWEAFGSMFAENAIMLPMTGGMVEGRDGIRQWHETAIATTDVRSSRREKIGENVILDIGTFTATLSEGAGGGTLEGEYVTVVENGDTGLQIRSLSTFPMRQGPDAPAQE